MAARTPPIPSAANPSPGAFNHAVVVAPSDGADLTHTIQGFIVFTTVGTIKFDTVGGETVTLGTVILGQLYPIRVAKIYATGTTAVGILGLYS